MSHKQLRESDGSAEDEAWHQGASAQWIRHADYYVDPGESPGVPGPVPTEEELRQGRWGKLRASASFPVIIFIRIWRKVISPLYGEVCSFYPSCSAYGLEAVTTHGLLKGSARTAWRILRCNPWSGGGVDHVPISPRIWPQGQVPSIIETNHPPMDDEETGRDSQVDRLP